MHHNLFSKLLNLSIAIIFSLSLFGQQAGNSPYSRFGIGELGDNNFNHTRQMGGLGASYVDGFHINIINPASYSYLNATAFDVGIFAKHTWISDATNTTKIWSGNLEYLSLAFPLKNPINELYEGSKSTFRLGMNFTLMPHSNVNYSISSIDSISGINQFTRNYVGTGGTYKVLWGNSLKYKDFSFGVNLGYLFGKISYDKNLEFEDSDYAYNTTFTNDYNVKGFLWNFGFLYTKIVNTKAVENNKLTPVKRISIGLHGNSATSFSTTSSIFERQVQSISNSFRNIDTIQLINGISGKGRLPAEFGLGATYYIGEKSAIGINYSTAFWSKYYNNASGDTQGNLGNSSKLSVGGYFRPNYKSFDNFLERVYYRYGLYYDKDARIINNERIHTYGLTFGFGLPFVFQRKISHTNIGVDLGMRGQNTPISEKFVKISFGVTFNDDEWFLKRKYN